MNSSSFEPFGYQRALYLLYGMSVDEALHTICVAGVRVKQMASIEIWVHSYPGARAERVH